MAQRLINSDITTKDTFITLPQSAQLLYYRLIENADSEGFINNVFIVLKAYGFSTTDIKNLAETGYLLENDGFYVITHWFQHNIIRPTRIKESKSPLRAYIYINRDLSYTFRETEDNIYYLDFYSVVKKNLNKPHGITWFDMIKGSLCAHA